TRHWVGINHWILLIISPTEIESTMKPKKQSCVESGREARRSKDDVIGALALVTRHGIGEWLESDERLNPRAADDFAGPVFGVVGRESEELSPSAKVSSGDKIQFIGASGLVDVDQTVDAIIPKIKITGCRVKRIACWIAQSRGNLR